MIDMDFVVGPHETLGKYDYIWVMVYRLTKPTHFIMVRIDYNVEQLAKVYVKEMVRFHKRKPFGVDLGNDSEDKVRSIQS